MHVAQPDLRPLFSIVLSKACFYMHTITAPTPHQFIAMCYNACKMHQKLLNCITQKNGLTSVAKPDLLGQFSQLFRVEHSLVQ